MNTITKKILIDRIAESTGMKRVAVKQVVQEFLDQVIVELGDGNRLEFRDFGVFEVKQRAPRIAQNPKTLERVPVPAKRTVKFKVGRRMREAMDSESPTPTPAVAGVSTHELNGTRLVTASQAEGKVQVEIGSSIAGSIHTQQGSNQQSASEPETASVR
jgi:integration host factor subunit beta